MQPVMRPAMQPGPVMTSLRPALWLCFIILVPGAGCGDRPTALGDHDLGGHDGATPRVDGGPTSDSGPTSDGPPCCGGSWSCTGGDVGDTCRALFAALPPGPSPWRCHQRDDAWQCDGKHPVGGVPIPPAPPGSKPWSCETIAVVGSSPDGSLPYPGYDEIVRCSRPVAATDKPPAVDHVACVLGSAFSGLRCTILAAPAKPPTPWAAPDERCEPGQRRWCEGLQYSGWGQLTCLPSGRWPTKTVNGKQVLDCQELPNGRRPDTLCACYSFYPKLDCCERVDCVVALRDDGAESSQLCPQSEGKACDYCNPQKPECKGSDSQCLLTNIGEAFCAEPCGPAKSCPQGYTCETIKNRPLDYCVPADLGCYD
jgi:hypothetical protein